MLFLQSQPHKEKVGVGYNGIFQMRQLSKLLRSSVLENISFLAIFPSMEEKIPLTVLAPLARLFGDANAEMPEKGRPASFFSLSPPFLGACPLPVQVGFFCVLLCCVVLCCVRLSLPLSVSLCVSASCVKTQHNNPSSPFLSSPLLSPSSCLLVPF